MILVLLLMGGGGGLLAYQHYREVQILGQDVYKELDGDDLPPLPGVLDDPVFKQLPPPPADQPVSLGRYKRKTPPKAPATRPKSSTVPGPDQADPVSPVPSAASAPPVKLAPTTFLERVRTSVKIHVLLMGNDQSELDKGRADVLVVLTFDPRTRTLTFLSIPRDTRAQIPEHEVEKINAGYAIGGPTLQTIAVEQFLGIPMDKFVEVSMDGFQKAIDLVGGVTVNPHFAFELDGQSFKPGAVKLSGEQALAYSRMRKQDPRGDLGRNTRQQEVLRSLMAALGKLSAEELNRVLEQLKNDIRTNFSPSEVVELRQQHSYMLEHQKVLNVQGQNQRLGGLWYYTVSDAERQRLHLLLR